MTYREAILELTKGGSFEDLQEAFETIEELVEIYEKIDKEYPYIIKWATGGNK